MKRMRYRLLDGTGWNVSAVSFGAWQLGDETFWGRDDEADAEAAVRCALDCGVNLFDTAEMYGDGESERVLGAALGADHARVHIATKVSPENCAPDRLRNSCEQSLRRLGRDWIDLYQVHWPCRDVSFDSVQETMETLRQEGKIRAVGVSNFGVGDMGAWMASGKPTTNQIGYNLLFRAPEYGLIPECRRNGIGVLAYMPLMQGLLAGRYEAVADIPMLRRRTRHFSSARSGTRHGESGHEDLLMDTVLDLRDFAEAIGIPMATMCLSWLVAQPGVTSVVLGARNERQLRGNLEAADLYIGPAAVAQLNEITYPLKRAMGQNCDMWQSEGDSRVR